MFRSGYILDARADWFWFLGFPFLAIAIALGCHEYLPAIALASIGLWITIPHHLATWLRTYGLGEDWRRWKGPLIAGPVVVFATTMLGLRWAPMTLLVLGFLWDHQHSLMQQYGLSRIYDFKARTGGPRTARFDLGLHWFLYVNMLLTGPLFIRLWGSEAYQWRLPLSAETFRWIQHVSWGATAAYLLIYLGQIIWSAHVGQAINPVKYLFICSSYVLWYFTSWQTDSFLVFGIAHRLMHGMQYMIIVNSYLDRKQAAAGLSTQHDATPVAPPILSPPVASPAFAWLMPSGRTLAIIGMGAAYALVYQLLVLRPLDEFGFGVVNFMRVGAGPQRIGDITRAAGYDLFAATMVQALPITHYYFDSFIWKVSDARLQQGL